MTTFADTLIGIGKLRAAVIVSALALGSPAAAEAAERTATPATLDRVFDAARGGDTILLASGNYGSFRGGEKPARVTLRPQAGASATMSVDFRRASKINLVGLELTNVEIWPGSSDITIRDSDIPGQVVLSDLEHANVLLERNLHHDWDKCESCGEGRVFVTGRSGAQPSGVTIRDSEFRGGVSDGILNGANGTQIIGNEFHDLVQGTPNGVHTDAIQLYGSRNTVIRRNYFHDVPVAIMSPDGADHELIEDNVIAGDRGGYPYAITLWSDDGSVIRHNTLADGPCMFNLRCGILSLGSKSDQDPGRGTIVKDNILADITVADGRAAVAERSHNLIAHGRASHPAEIRGRPDFVGGLAPTAFAGYALAKGSPGAGNASDGLNRGARIGDARCLQAMKRLQQASEHLRRALKKAAKAGGGKAKKNARRAVRKARAKKRKASRAVQRLC